MKFEQIGQLLKFASVHILLYSVIILCCLMEHLFIYYRHAVLYLILKSIIDQAFNKIYRVDIHCSIYVS
jgi:hypothetical protein